MSARALLLVAVAAGLAGCGDGSGPPLPQTSSLRVLHAIRGGPSLTVFVDGARGSTLAFGQLGRTTLLSPGVHELILVPSDTSHSSIVDFTAAEGVGYNAFAIDSTAGATHTVEPVIVPDTGSLPAVGHSRLRIASYAPGAPPIDAWRTQPDSSGLVVSAQPLNFRALTRFFDRAGRLERRDLPRRHDRHADCHGSHRDDGWTSTVHRGPRFDPRTRHLAAGAEPELAARAAAANCRTMSPAGSMLVMPLTLFPACQ